MSKPFLVQFAIKAVDVMCSGVLYQPLHSKAHISADALQAGVILWAYPADMLSC